MKIIIEGRTQINAEKIQSKSELERYFGDRFTKKQLDSAWKKIKKANGISTKTRTRKNSQVSD